MRYSLFWKPNCDLDAFGKGHKLFEHGDGEGRSFQEEHRSEMRDEKHFKSCNIYVLFSVMVKSLAMVSMLVPNGRINLRIKMAQIGVMEGMQLILVGIVTWMGKKFLLSFVMDKKGAVMPVWVPYLVK